MFAIQVVVVDGSRWRQNDAGGRSGTAKLSNNAKEGSTSLSIMLCPERSREMPTMIFAGGLARCCASEDEAVQVARSGTPHAARRPQDTKLHDTVCISVLAN